MIRLVPPVQNTTDCLSRERITVLHPALNARAYKQLDRAPVAALIALICYGVRQLPKYRRELFDLPFSNQSQVEDQPALPGKFIGWIQLASRVPERLAVPGRFRFAIF